LSQLQRPSRKNQQGQKVAASPARFDVLNAMRTNLLACGASALADDVMDISKSAN